MVRIETGYGWEPAEEWVRFLLWLLLHSDDPQWVDAQMDANT